MGWWLWTMLGSVVLFSSVASGEEPSVVINELLYDVPGSDTGNEWVELFNVSGSPVDLSGWNIQRGGTTFTTVFTFPGGASIAPGSFLLVGEQNVASAAFQASLVFQNGGDATDGVRIVTGDGTVVDVLLYGEPNAHGLPDRSGAAGTAFAPDVPEGHSLARIPDGRHSSGDSRDFSNASAPTPGAKNAGDIASSPPTSAEAAGATAGPSSISESSGRVVVNEVLPNPLGSDEEGEFVELWNSGTDSANLLGFSLDDAEGGSAPYALHRGTSIPPKGYLVLRRNARPTV